MKKILIGLLLIVALVAISYYSASRSDGRARKEFQDGYDKGARETAVHKARADSLENALRQEKSQYADSLQILALTHGTVVDSLTQTIAAKDKELVKQADRRKLATRKNGDNSKSKSVAAKSGVSHAQILEYYRKKLLELPSDLSPYERSVALTEIRDQTSRKFTISAQDLQKIREDSNLTE